MAPMLIREVDDEPAKSHTLELTPVEAILRRLLLDVADYIDNSPTLPDPESQVRLPKELANEKLILRFTGGWVRDKLLGVPSHDIDVAINKMTGYQFGLRLKEYLEIPGNPEKYGLEGVATNEKQSQKAGISEKSKVVGGLHKIEANPEKSKHLETVATKILGLDIDLVNLRKETYTEDSRTPQMEFGTPEEDAMRRDATINAMFYNINTEEVEDFTGRGQDDLRKEVIRTPLDPHQTFRDDPLRILRLIRFASRLGYTIDQDAQITMRDREIKDALRRKISRERHGIEVEKMLKGPDPHEALRLIFELELYEIIFCDPTVEPADHHQPDIVAWQTIIDALQEVIRAGAALAEILMRDDEERYLAWQLAALVPYSDAPQLEAAEPGRKLPPPIAATVAREGIKATNKVCDIITSAVRNQFEISALIDRHYMQKRRPDKKIEREDASARDVLGMAIRQWGSSWRSQVVYSMLVEIANDSEATSHIERKYTMFVEHLQRLNILEAWSFKPLMDGKTLANAIGTSPGPWMKDALDVVMAYQLRHPGTAKAEHAIAEVHKHRQDGVKRGELTSSLIKHFLTLTIRPMFLKAKPTTVTGTGRKNTTTVLLKKMTAESMDDSLSKPWKSSKDAYVLDLLQWCVDALDERIVEEVWPSVIPPLLTLVDDWEAKYKHLGVELVGKVLKITTPSLLTRTGLGEVFEDAIMPCLTYLPTITEEEESISLLNATYPTLTVLATVRYPKSQPANTKHTSSNVSRQRTKFLDTIIRKGIIYSYTHCGNYPRIVSTLFTNLVPILNELGIESVKHLKYILPALTETLSHPLADAQLETLLSSAKALQAVILNGWPRMVEYRGEVLKGLTFCWIKIAGMEGKEVERLRSEMKETVKMLRYAVRREVDLDQDCHMLAQADPRVKELLDI